MAANKYLALDPTTNLPKETAATQTSAGTANAGQLAALNAAGVLDSTLFPAGIGEASQVFPTSENLAASALVNVWSNAGTASVRNANATDATKPANAFVTGAVVTPANATVFFPGQIVTGVAGLTIGLPVFLSAATPGGVTSVAPNALGNLVQQVGTALSATSFVFQPMAGIIHG